jgi:hypothetical protein
MRVLDRPVARLPRYPVRRLVWRSLLAAPFALAAAMTIVLGPATIDSPHASFTLLAAVSLLAAVLMLVVADGPLILVGLVTFLAFPLVACLGFNFAPDWARPVVAAIFYGSILASAAATLTGIVVVLRRLLRRHPRAMAIPAAGLAVLVLAAGAAMASTPTGAAGMASISIAAAVNLGSVINTPQREAEPTFSADGRTMVFNCRDYMIAITPCASSGSARNRTNRARPAGWGEAVDQRGALSTKMLAMISTIARIEPTNQRRIR